MPIYALCLSIPPDDAPEEGGDTATMLAHMGMAGASCLSHESLYADDPKKSIKTFFERQGIDPPPQYEFVEGRFGQQNCRLEFVFSYSHFIKFSPQSANTTSLLELHGSFCGKINVTIGRFNILQLFFTK